MDAEAEKPQEKPESDTSNASQIALRGRELAVDVDSLLAGELEPLEFAKELDTQFELVLDINKALESDLRQAREGLRDLKRRHAQLEKLVRKAKADIKQGRGLDGQLAKARTSYEHVLEELDRAKHAIEQQDLILKKKDDKIGRLTEASDRLKYEIGVLKSKIEGVRGEKAEINNRLQTVHFDLRDYEEQKRGLEEAIKEVRLRTEATQDNILKIKRTLSNVLTAFANTRNKARLRFGRVKAVNK